jgi:superfamily I DNA and/or RNA helicase
MQLPTIVRSDHPQVRDWLGRHVFASAGADVPERDHPQRVMLIEQYRMHPDISGLVSHHFYADKLCDSKSVLDRNDPGPAILLLDTADGACRSESTRTSSKQNPTHARIVSELVLSSPSKDIAIITPYRAQVRAVREELRARAPEALGSGEVEVFTVHRFQGRDKDLVIFDTVEAPGTPCRFLDELRNPAARNLINVALSRARRRLIIVGHLRHVVAGLGSDSILGRIFRHVRLRGGVELEWACEADRAEVSRFLKGAG